MRPHLRKGLSYFTGAFRRQDRKDPPPKLHGDVQRSKGYKALAAKVNEKRRCVIIAGSPQTDIQTVKAALRPDDYVICADMGYKTAAAAGIKPDLIVGDFDSYTGSLPNDCEIIRLLPEKDDTDTMHCVKTALERGFCDFLLLAATGGRLDHTLGNLTALEYLAENNAHGIILSKNETIEVLTKGRFGFTGRRGQTFSVFPFGCQSAVLSYKGAKYPLKRGTLLHSEAMGVSNVFTEDKAEITVDDGQIVLIINF